MLSRRSFLNSTLGAGLASATSDQAAAPTPAVQPVRKRLIVDAQVHVWKAESADWPWIPGLKPQMRAAHHREAGAVDGRGRRRSRRHRAAGLAGLSQRLWS